MGEMQFKERGEQAEPEGTAEAEKVSFLLGVNSNDFIKCLIKPKIKVGTTPYFEWFRFGSRQNFQVTGTQINLAVG
jgi:myosin heavy subunit